MQPGDILLSLTVIMIILAAFLRYDRKVKDGSAKWEDVNPYRKDPVEEASVKETEEG